MELLRTAVVDVTTLVAACHALKAAAAEGADSLQRRLRSRLRQEIKRGTVAYLDTLARTRRGTFDEALLAKCRVAAERQMPQAMAHKELLGRILTSESGSLDGLAVARQDLWRLAHLGIHLSTGMAALGKSNTVADMQPTSSLAQRLRRRFRKALVAYARTALRSKAAKGKLVGMAREAALSEIGKRGAAEAERLADLEAGAGPVFTLLRLGVTKPLMDLAMDWQPGAG